MAKVDAMPARAVIDGLRGVIDFYEWCGLNIVRSWPRYAPSSQSKATKAAQLPFQYIATAAPLLAPEVVESWQWLASQSNLTWRDWMERAYLGATLAAPGKPWP